jgi:hypothetical protein
MWWRKFRREQLMEPCYSIFKLRRCEPEDGSGGTGGKERQSVVEAATFQRRESKQVNSKMRNELPCQKIL